MHYIWAMLQALLCIGLLTFATYLTMKKMNKKQYTKSSQHSHMQIIDGMNVGMRQQLFLVKVRGEYLVVANGSQGIQQMVKLDGDRIEGDKVDEPKETFEEYFTQDKPSYVLQDVAKKIKGRLMKGEES